MCSLSLFLSSTGYTANYISQFPLQSSGPMWLSSGQPTEPKSDTQCFHIDSSSVKHSCVSSPSVMFFVTPWTAAHQASLSIINFPELAQIHVHPVGDAIQPSHPLLSPSPPAFNLSQHQGLFQWASPSHQVGKVLQFQLQYQSFQWLFRTDSL